MKALKELFGCIAIVIAVLCGLFWVYNYATAFDSTHGSPVQEPAELSIREQHQVLVDYCEKDKSNQVVVDTRYQINCDAFAHKIQHLRGKE